MRTAALIFPPAWFGADPHEVIALCRYRSPARSSWADVCGREGMVHGGRCEGHCSL